MASDLILVNGLPGSGKTTLGRGLASHLGASFLSKDELKESLQTATPEAAALEPLGVVAMKAAWTLAQGFPGMVIIDSWWFRPRDLEHARDGIAASGCSRALEIWSVYRPSSLGGGTQTAPGPSFIRTSSTWKPSGPVGSQQRNHSD